MYVYLFIFQTLPEYLIIHLYASYSLMCVRAGGRAQLDASRNARVPARAPPKRGYRTHTPLVVTSRS